MDIEKRMELILRKPTQEVLTQEELRKLLESKKTPAAYLGTAPTGPFHMGYLVAFSKLVDMSNAGIKPKVLIADIHAAMDDLKTPWDQLEKRTEYYKKCVELSFPWKKLPEFVVGSSFQYSKEYEHDLLKMCTMTTVARATRAASEVTRMKNPKVSELVYPLMQSLDEEYLDVDIQLGGMDQRHIMALAREILPEIGYKPRVEVMTSLIVSFKGPGAKMSASVPESHIKVYESEESITNKVKKAYCPEGVVQDNPILQLTAILFALNGKLKVERDKKFGGDLVFETYDELEQAFAQKKLHPVDLKNAATVALIDTFKTVRKYYEKNKSKIEELGPTFLAD